MAAATIAVAATAATAASAAYKASNSGGKGGGGPALPTTPLYEKLLNKGTANILDNANALMSDSVAQANFLTPELYKVLGYEPIYDGPDPSAAIKDAGAEVDRLQGQFHDVDAKVRALRAQRGKSPRVRREIQRLKKERRGLERQLEGANRTLQDIQTQPRRITGFRPAEGGPPDPTGSKDNLFRMALDLENETLIRALKGEEPIDATLKTSFEEKERVLRERLRRQLGPDYETSTAGAQALANFDRERSEAFTQFNRETIAGFSKLTESRAGALSDLTNARLQQLLYPSNAQAGRAQALSNLTQDRNAFVQLQEQKRTGQFGRAMDKAKFDAQQQQARTDAIAGALDTGAGALGGLSAGGSLSNVGSSISSRTADIAFGQKSTPDFVGPPEPGLFGGGR